MKLEREREFKTIQVKFLTKITSSSSSLTPSPSRSIFFYATQSITMKFLTKFKKEESARERDEIFMPSLEMNHNMRMNLLKAFKRAREREKATNLLTTEQNSLLNKKNNNYCINAPRTHNLRLFVWLLKKYKKKKGENCFKRWRWRRSSLCVELNNVLLLPVWQSLSLSLVLWHNFMFNTLNNTLCECRTHIFTHSHLSLGLISTFMFFYIYLLYNSSILRERKIEKLSLSIIMLVWLKSNTLSNTQTLKRGAGRVKVKVLLMWAAGRIS